MSNKCYEYALHYIYRFPKTEKELIIQLNKKGFKESEIDEAMNLLKKAGYVDDEKFAKAYVHSELIKKGKPMVMIKAKLLQKGISKDIMNTAISEHENEIGEGISDKIRKEIDKYKSKGMEGFDIIQKLMSKGYTLDQIKKVL